MGIHELVPGKVYRIFIYGMGNSGRKNVHAETIHGTETDAREREAELFALRDTGLYYVNGHWQKIVVPPDAYQLLREMSREIGMIPDAFNAELIRAAADKG